MFFSLPQWLAGERDTGRKEMTSLERKTSANLKVLWDFEGYFRYSPMFYGFYNNVAATKAGYQIPLAYFIVGMAVYVFSFVMILVKMEKNSRQSKLAEKVSGHRSLV